MLREAFQYATKHTTFFDIQQNEEINKRCKIKEPATQQHLKNARLVIKKTLNNQYLQNWLETKLGHQQVQERNLHKRKLQLSI